MKNFVWLLLICFLLAESIAFAAANPFITKKHAQEPPSALEMKVPRLLQPALTRIAAWQRVIHARLTILGKEIRTNPHGKAFWRFLVFAFIYGMIHALGPGHGKTIVVSYFFSHPGHYLHGLIMGFVLSVVHVFSAVAIIISIRLALQTTRGLTAFDTASCYVEYVSYGLLMLLGGMLCVRTIYEWRQGRQPASAETETHSLKRGVFTAVVTGLIPCPGAALILLFTLSQQIMLAGLLAMLCLATGMGLTTASFACLAITSRTAILRQTTRHHTLLTLSCRLLSLTGGVVILTVGMMCFIGVLV